MFYEISFLKKDNLEGKSFLPKWVNKHLKKNLMNKQSLQEMGKGLVSKEKNVLKGLKNTKGKVWIARVSWCHHALPSAWLN